ncbi:microcystinase C (plasmid) [Mesorhizobium sp. 131-3-5]|uniref:M81 family metallopeptidase n=1 Tax=Mesorhizobium sp. 131-3-5 TaxID=2744520 RepID=UPI0018EB1B39|nr:M81 family metallopeptidase [Mesorhizobium sp. 131-3-5]BCH12558.1 microcystinase C [Mesorhizobium sp. 131-3-5]
MKKRVAIAGFLHETNTFAPTRARYANFEHGGGFMPISRGKEILERCRNTNLGVAGFVDYASSAGWEIVPLLWAVAIPSAHVEQEAYERIAGEIIDRVRAAGPLDGLLIELHGAMVAEHLDDGEGELLARLRAQIGPEVPVAATLDLHGNVTPRMVEQADVLVAYQTYPHVDMARTGWRTAEQLDAIIARGKPFAKAFRQLPFLIPTPWQCTLIEPASALYEQIGAVERGPVSSASILMGFPAADFEDCLPCVLAYGETHDDADAAAERLESYFLKSEGLFAGKAWSSDDAVAEAIRLAFSASKPVVIADTQDNPGAGGDSDTTGMLRALLVAGAENAALGIIFDPESAARAHRAGAGAKVELSLGGKSGIAGDEPLCATYHVDALSDGAVTATGPYYGGTKMQLGPSACISIDGVQIVVTSEKTQMADRQLYRFVGIEPEKKAILVNKSSVHFRADFEPIATAVLVATAPGAMLLDPAQLPFTRLKSGTRLSPGGPPFTRRENSA